MVLQPSALQNALDAIANYSGMIAGIPGNPYGWAFGLGGAAAAAAASAIGTGAVPLLDVQQTISSDALLKLTNGYTWSIEQTGSTTANGDCGFFGSCDWDWQLGVEAWGCAALKATHRCSSARAGAHLGRYGPFVSPQPHFGIGASTLTSAPGCEFITASRVPHSR